MSQVTDLHETDTLDILLLDILRCEPVSMVDFSGYGTLPRSVFQLIQKQLAAQDFIQARKGIVVSFPYESPVKDDFPGIQINPSRNPDAVQLRQQRRHILSYNLYQGVETLLANCFNRYSNESDFKLFARARVAGNDACQYYLNLVILEVYRGKGNGHPVWEIGFYVQDSQLRTVYQETAIIDIPDIERIRTRMQSLCCNFASGMPNLTYQTNRPYLDAFTNQPELLVITPKEFGAIKEKRFRYLAGTLDTRLKWKLEDRSNPRNPHKNRVVLVSNHLMLDEDNKYHILIFEGDKEIRDGPFDAKYAAELFFDTAQSYLSQILRNAGFSESAFDLHANAQKRDVRYITTARDSAGKSIILCSLESTTRPDCRGLQEGNVHHYIQFYNAEGHFLTLQEEFCQQGVQWYFTGKPRDFMEDLVAAIPKVNIADRLTFAQQIKEASPTIPFYRI